MGQRKVGIIMRCRQIVNVDGQTKQIVWFNRVILKALPLCSDETVCSNELTCSNRFVYKTADNYLDRQAGVASSLTQRLSIIRGELYYAVNEGLPIADKVSSKAIIDAKIIEIASKHPDVKSITEFRSVKDKHSYTCSFKANTTYGELVVTV